MVDRFGAAKFLAFLENPNPRETEFLSFLENPKIALSMEAVESVRVVSRFGC